MLVVGVYRSDEIPRAHRSGGCATSCAATGCCAELTLEPLTAAGHGRARRAGARRGALAAARPHAARPHGRHPRSSSRSSPPRWSPAAACSAATRGGARARRRGAAAADDPRRRAAPRRRPLRSGPRDRRGGRRWRAPRSTLELVADARRRGGPRRAARRAGSIVEVRARTGPRSGTRSRATRSTRTCPGCAVARCTGSWPWRWRRASPARRRSPRTGWRRATAPRALDSLVRAVGELRRRPRLPGRGAAGAPGARPVARG